MDGQLPGRPFMGTIVDYLDADFSAIVVKSTYATENLLFALSKVRP